MKQKTHSGAKKRIKVRKSGVLMVEKSSRRHLLTNKSTRQKNLYSDGMPVSKTRMESIKRMLPGKV